jgi:energy-coupling factor transporter transmembrane protein EcfT
LFSLLLSSYQCANVSSTAAAAANATAAKDITRRLWKALPLLLLLLLLLLHVFFIFMACCLKNVHFFFLGHWDPSCPDFAVSVEAKTHFAVWVLLEEIN